MPDIFRNPVTIKKPINVGMERGVATRGAKLAKIHIIFDFSELLPSEALKIFATVTATFDVYQV